MIRSRTLSGRINLLITERNNARAANDELRAKVERLQAALEQIAAVPAGELPGRALSDMARTALGLQS